MRRWTWVGVVAAVIVVVLAVAFGTKVLKPKDIPIGAILPLTGQAAQWGVPAKQGVELAVEQINAGGGVVGRRLKLYIQDSAGDPKTAVSAFQSLLVKRPDIQAVVGAVASSETLAIAPIAERRRVVLISPASTNPRITDAGDFIFRDIPTDALRGKVFAEYVFAKAKISRIAVMYINNDAGVGNKDVFVRRFRQLGGVVLGEEAYAEGTRDVRTQLAKIKALKPQALMVVSYPDDTIVVVKQARELVPKMPLFFQAEAVEDPAVRKALGAALNGVTYILPAKPEGKVPQRFAGEYKRKHGTEPELFAAEGYDCVQLVADGVRASGGIARATSIRDHLYSVRDYGGASGIISFDHNGDVVKPMSVKRIVGSIPVVVFTSS